MHLLDDPAWNALTGPHAGFADGDGPALRYRTDMSPFAAVADRTDPEAWARLATLTGPGVVDPGPAQLAEDHSEAIEVRAVVGATFALLG